MRKLKESGGVVMWAALIGPLGAAISGLVGACGTRGGPGEQVSGAGAETESAGSGGWDESTLPRFASEVARPDLAARGAVGRRVDNLRVTTLAGAMYSLDDLLRDKRGVVIAMASVECPIAKKYAPRMGVIEREHEGQFAFVHVNTVEGEAAEAIRDAAMEAGFRGLYARDAGGVVRRELMPRTTTEVFVIDSERVLRYRGAIDDGFRFGGAASRVRRAFLRDALRAVAAGERVEVASTQAPGCLVDIPEDAANSRATSDAGNKDAAPITFYPKVADVVARNCMECHATRGVGPFRLATPADFEGRVSMVAAMVREQIMPPNHGLAWEGESPLVTSRMMTREDRETLLAWLASDRAVGAAPRQAGAVPPDALADNTWAIGTPDQIIVAPGPLLSAHGSPVFGRFFVPVNNERDEWITAIETRPTMHDSIDTATIWLIRAGDVLPSLTDLPRAAELFATFSKPDRVVRYEDAAGRWLPAGSVLAVDIQARPTGKETRANLRIAMAFAKPDASPVSASGRATVRVLGVAPDRLEIAPNDSDARILASRTFNQPARIVALTPVLGQRGREVTVELHQPGQPVKTLLDLRRWDWRWLTRYPLARPIDAPAGARVVVRARFDNSDANPANPDATSSPTLGVGPGREMMYVAFETRSPAPAGAETRK